jgi:hypothetical protein
LNQDFSDKNKVVYSITYHIDVLLLFELIMSSLKVHFHKSMLAGVNISDSWLIEAAFALRCRVGQIPFIYLGLPIGGDQRRLGF